MGGLIDMSKEGWESIIQDHDCDRGWIYRIVIGVTSDVGMTSTYPVVQSLKLLTKQYGISDSFALAIHYNYAVLLGAFAYYVEHV